MSVKSVRSVCVALRRCNGKVVSIFLSDPTSERGTQKCWMSWKCRWLDSAKRGEKGFFFCGENTRHSIEIYQCIYVFIYNLYTIMTVLKTEKLWKYRIFTIQSMRRDRVRCRLLLPGALPGQLMR
jgi:hypothetical protein